MGYNTEFDGEFALSRRLDAGTEQSAVVEMTVAFAAGRFGDLEIGRLKCA